MSLPKPKLVEAVPAPRELAIACPRCRAEAKFVERWSGLGHHERLTDEAVNASPHKLSVARTGNGQLIDRFPDLPRAAADPAETASSLWWDGREGVCLCPQCANRAPHVLCWPDHAWFRGTVRGEVLWAFDRKHLVAIRAYIAMTGDRNTVTARGGPWSAMMHKLPRKVVLGRNRETALKAIDAMLAGDRAQG